MKGRLSIGLVALAVVTAFLASDVPSVSAQRAVDLYAGCNNVSLSFLNGTAIGDVVDAAVPSSAVESIWRHNAAANTWEGYSPAIPQAGNLPTVNCGDAVWVCVTGAVRTKVATMSMPDWQACQAGGGGGGGGEPQPTADLALTRVFVHPPANTKSRVNLEIQNNGPDSVTNVKVTSQCSHCLNGACTPPGAAVTHDVTLANGAKASFETPLIIDTTGGTHKVECSITPSLNGDVAVNNSNCWGACGPPPGGPATADLELAKVFVHPPPPNASSVVHVQILNNGPDNVTNVQVTSECWPCSSLYGCFPGNKKTTTHNVTLANGTKADFASDLVIDTSSGGSGARCTIVTTLNSDGTGNNRNCWGSGCPW